MSKFTFIAKGKEAQTPLAQKQRGGERIGVWTDGLMLSSDHEPGWPAAFRLFRGRTYRVTVEEIDGGSND